MSHQNPVWGGGRESFLVVSLNTHIVFRYTLVNIIKFDLGLYRAWYTTWCQLSNALAINPETVSVAPTTSSPPWAFMTIHCCVTSTGYWRTFNFRITCIFFFLLLNVRKRGGNEFKILLGGGIPFWEFLNGETVLSHKMHNIEAVPTLKMNNAGTVPMFKIHNVGIPKIYDLCLELEFLCVEKINNCSLHHFFYLNHLGPIF